MFIYKFIHLCMYLSTYPLFINLSGSLFIHSFPTSLLYPFFKMLYLFTNSFIQLFMDLFLFIHVFIIFVLGENFSKPQCVNGRYLAIYCSLS